MVSFIALVITGRREAMKGSADIRMRFSEGVVTLENHGPQAAMAVGVLLAEGKGAGVLRPVGDMAPGEMNEFAIKTDHSTATLYLQWSIGGSRNRVKKYRIHGGHTVGDGWPTLLRASLVRSPRHRLLRVRLAYAWASLKQLFY